MNIWVRHYRWPLWLKAMYYARKWLWCARKHRRHRCYPGAGGWHCHDCHPCGEEIDRLIYGIENKTIPLDAINPVAVIRAHPERACAE